MNKIINQYLIINFLKIVINTVLIFFTLGIILNLFEEIEFFKNLNESFTLPFLLSLSFIPTLIIELLPFIIFLASMFYFLNLKSSKDLLSIKIFGYSNLKITLTIGFFSFIFGFLVLIAVNPLTSALVKYYETEKAIHAKDVDHLISVNKNGLWIKEITNLGYKIINAEELKGDMLKNISIYIFDSNNNVIKRIEAESAFISDNPWILNNVYVFDFKNNNRKEFNKYELKTEKVLDKINSLYKNLNTVSFIDLIKNYRQLNEIGYSKNLLNKQNYYYIILSILTSVIIFYFKDLSIALGQTEKINLILSVWMPIIVIGLFCSIGVIQINEK